MLKKSIILNIFFIVLFYTNLYSQKDTTICFDISFADKQTDLKNIWGLDVCYLPGNPAPMLGINHERALSRNNTISFSVGSNNYPHGHYDDITTYGKLEYRFYFPDTGIPKPSSFNSDFYLQKKKKTLRSHEGLYIGLVAIYKNYQPKTTNFNYVKPNTEFINSYGIGGSLGYQFALFNKIQTNISLPLTFAFQRIAGFENSKLIKETGYDFSLFINISFGIAFSESFSNKI